VAVKAVVFDWGGTLTPHHTIDLLDLWRVAARVLAPDRVEEVAQALAAAELRWWEGVGASGLSGTTADVLAAASAETGLDVDAALHDAALEAHLDAWTPHTIAHPEVVPLLTALRERGIRTGLLSNTHWPRRWHEHWLERDGVIDLIDARVYTSDLAHTKPHPEAFGAVLGELGVRAGDAVFVGDRPIDDISGAKGIGMRAVLVDSSDVPGHPVVPDARISHVSQVLPLVDGWIAESDTARHSRSWR
jgi:putative hydrolase of the HAD superfamily